MNQIQATTIVWRNIFIRENFWIDKKLLISMIYLSILFCEIYFFFGSSSLLFTRLSESAKIVFQLTTKMEMANVYFFILIFLLLMSPVPYEKNYVATLIIFVVLFILLSSYLNGNYVTPISFFLSSLHYPLALFVSLGLFCGQFVQNYFKILACTNRAHCTNSSWWSQRTEKIFVFKLYGELCNRVHYAIKIRE